MSHRKSASAAASALIDAINKHNEREPSRQMLFLNYSAVDPALTNEKCSYWHFRWDAHADVKMAALTGYMKNNPKIKKVYLINQNGILIGPGARVSAYVTGYAPPISLGGRFRTFRWIIPSYDQVLVTPLVSMFAGLLAFAGAKSLGWPPDVVVPVTATPYAARWPSALPAWV